MKIRLCALLFLLVALPSQVSAQQRVSVGDTDLGGVVTGPSGPEAGVWVIAETTDLPTKFTKIVSTDDLGRYLIPDLPRANYRVWVRGFGLVDSPKVQASPGRNLDLTAVPARSEKAAARVLPSHVLVVAAQSAGEERIPVAEDQEPWRVAQHHQGRRLRLVPRARHARHADSFQEAR